MYFVHPYIFACDCIARACHAETANSLTSPVCDTPCARQAAGWTCFANICACAGINDLRIQSRMIGSDLELAIGHTAEVHDLSCCMRVYTFSKESSAMPEFIARNLLRCISSIIRSGSLSFCVMNVLRGTCCVMPHFVDTYAQCIECDAHNACTVTLHMRKIVLRIDFC